MARDRGLLDKVFQQRMLRRWARAARSASSTEPAVLARQLHQAQLLRRHLTDLIYRAEGRLGPGDAASDLPKAHNADWVWRPEIWRGPLAVPGVCAARTQSALGTEVTVFHDCPHSELTLRQVRNIQAFDRAPFGLQMEVFRFEGSFLSLVIDLPQAAVDGLKRTHLLCMDAIIEVERPMKVFARANVQHGPNTEQSVRELPPEGNAVVEFDLTYTDLREKNLEKAWVDLIFEAPAMNQITLRDVILSRRPRAAY